MYWLARLFRYPPRTYVVILPTGVFVDQRERICEISRWLLSQGHLLSTSWGHPETHIPQGWHISLRVGTHTPQGWHPNPSGLAHIPQGWHTYPSGLATFLFTGCMSVPYLRHILLAACGSDTNALQPPFRIYM